MTRRCVIIFFSCVFLFAALCLSIFYLAFEDPSACYPKTAGELECYAVTKANWPRWYGPKTDYSISTGLNNSTQAEVVRIPECEPKMLYLFNRHSARYPDLGDLEKMSAILHSIRDAILASSKEGKVHLCQEDLEELLNWKPLYTLTDAAQAMQQGNVDVHMIAQRFKKRFPTLLPGTYSERIYKLGVSNRERTNQSLQAFMEKILDEGEFAEIIYPKADVKTVSFHKNCERKLWPNRTKPSRERFEEAERFRTSLIAERFVDNLKARLGLQDTNFTYTDFRQIAVECAVSYTAFRDSPWCAVLSKDDLLVTEFDDDIYDFYKDSYGRPLNPKMGCPVVNEMVTLFKDVSRNASEPSPRSVLYFAHSRDFKKLLGSFDLFRDEKPLTADGYCSDIQRNRKWRSSVISPYSANIAFVLFQCKGKFQVLTLLNEQPIKLPRCSYGENDYLCDLREFISAYNFPNCDIKRICTPAAIKEKWPDSHWEVQ